MRITDKQPQREELERLVGDFIRAGGVVSKHSGYVRLRCDNCDARKLSRPVIAGKVVTGAPCWRCGQRMSVH